MKGTLAAHYGLAVPVARQHVDLVHRLRLRIPTAADNGGTVPAAGRPIAFHGNQITHGEAHGQRLQLPDERAPGRGVDRRRPATR